MCEKFAVFILTHGRAKEQKTYRTLKGCGYTGEVYFVVDNTDEQLEEYKKLYGDNVLVFDKEDEWKKTDTMTNRKELKAVVYARNKVFDFAAQKGLTYFCACDDDITALRYKYPVNGKLKTVKIKSADRLFEAVCGFIEWSKFSCLSFSEEGAFIGGINKDVLKGLRWSMSHIMFYRTIDRIKYRGIWYEDMIASVDLMKQGRLAMGTMLVSVASPKTGSNKGGMQEAYQNSSEWIAAFNVVMANPDCTVVNHQRKINFRRSENAASPKILSERWRKEQNAE